MMELAGLGPTCDEEGTSENKHKQAEGTKQNAGAMQENASLESSSKRGESAAAVQRGGKVCVQW